MTRAIAASAALLFLLAGAARAQTPAPDQSSQSAPQSTTASAPSAGAPANDQGADAKSAKGKAAAPQASGVTVQGKRPDYRSSIDRRSYNLSNDLQAANGSLSDALRNVPTLDVDPQGNLSIRGDSNVTILVDGQPAPALNGPNRGDLLQQLPANQYERVEVMTNPSAAFRPEGTGGIVNLITKKNRGDQRTASVSAAGSTTPRDRVTASGSLGEPKLTLSGLAFAARQINQVDGQSTGHIEDPASGESAAFNSTSHNRQAAVGGMLYGDAAYTPDSRTRIDANLRYLDASAPSELSGAYRTSAMSGVLAQNYVYAGQGQGNFSILSGATTFTRQLGGQDHQFELHASYDATANNTDTRELFTYQLPVQPDLFQNLMSSQDQRTLDLKAEYKGPLPGQAKLTAGYELQAEDDTYGHSGLLGVSDATSTADPALFDRFDFMQSVNDLYATYQRPIGRFDIMPGLRLEQVTITNDQLSQAVRGRQSYFEAYPTFHMDYALDQNRRLFASYSRRVARPTGQQLDPFRVYNDRLDFTQGNPNLAPAITDSYEAGYEYTRGPTFLTASLYYKDAGNVIESVVENIGGGAGLFTFANIGHTRNAGLEMAAGGDITKTLSFNAGGDISWNQIATNDNGVVGPSTAAAMFGHVKLNWTATPKDFVQLSLYAHGRQITGQGSQASWETLSFGYRHKFSDRLAAEVIVQDPFDDFRWRTFIDTPTFDEVTGNNFHVRSLQIGLTYQLGLVRKQPPPKDFDFEGGGAGGVSGGGGLPH